MWTTGRVYVVPYQFFKHDNEGAYDSRSLSTAFPKALVDFPPGLCSQQEQFGIKEHHGSTHLVLTINL